MPIQLLEMDDGFKFYACAELEARFIYQEIFADLSYDDQTLPHEPFVIDAGANVGLFTLYVKSMRPKAKVLAFEPAPETALAFRKNMELHGVSDVELHEVALLEQHGDISLTYYPNMPGNSTLRPGEKALQQSLMAERFGQEQVQEMWSAQSVQVPGQPLSDFVSAATNSVDLLKIDIEGGELDALKGLSNEGWPRVSRIFAEVNDQRGDLAPVVALLEDRGFRVEASAVPFMWPELKFFYVTARR